MEPSHSSFKAPSSGCLFTSQLRIPSLGRCSYHFPTRLQAPRHTRPRYLDLEEQGGDDYELDFNLAYNPYCAYNDQYTCPIPPRENKLPVKILAGEKNYK